MLKKYFLLVTVFALCGIFAFAQENPFVTVIKINPATSVKNQANTGTCWDFSTTSLVESQNIHNGIGNFNISEMYTVRKMYIEKAKNYILRQGHAQFDQGGLGHDVIRCIAEYGAMPESAYTGLVNGEKYYNHDSLFNALQSYLDTLLAHIPIPDNWLTGYKDILNHYMGKPPATFTYEGREYTPKEFAKDVMDFNPNDYVGLTSFTDHPFNTSYIINIPDNYSNGYYYNVPLDELIHLVKDAVREGYTVMWDTDVTNSGWNSRRGYALAIDQRPAKGDTLNPDMPEHAYDQVYRQKLFDELITQDDHLMHITGLSKDKTGKEFFIVKNSWGTHNGPFEGYVYVSIPYFAINTVTIILPKAALNKDLVDKIAVSYPRFYQ